MKFIADTSVWIDHIQKPNGQLSALLTEKRILVHPVILGEMICGNFKSRHETLGNLKLLPRAEIASFEEAIELIEAEKIYGIGLGFSDIQILAAALLSDAGILTRDKAMQAAMKSLRIRSG